jgi:adenylate cyclase
MPRLSRRNATSLLAILALSTCLVVASQRWLPFVGGAENILSDLRLTMLTPPMPQDRQIVVIGITETTLERFTYRSPIDRAFLADLITALDASGASAIGIDILFDQATEPDKDAALAAALSAATTPIIAIRADMRDGLTERQVRYLDKATLDIETGFAGLPRDAYDGIVRNYAPWRTGADGEELSFAAAIVKTLGAEVPTGPFALAYRPPPGNGLQPFASYPAETVTLLPEPWLAGKIALIGADLAHSDRIRTPHSTAGGEDMAGVIVHAHALDQMLEHRSHPAIGGLGTALLVLLAAAAGVAAATVSRSLTTSVAMSVAALTLIWGSSFAITAAGGPMLPIIAPTLGLSVAAGMTGAYWRRRRANS